MIHDITYKYRVVVNKEEENIQLIVDVGWEVTLPEGMYYDYMLRNAIRNIIFEGVELSELFKPLTFKSQTLNGSMDFLCICWTRNKKTNHHREIQRSH